jgi:large subunit ribosomal protein L3
MGILLGFKKEMTQIFSEDGTVVPCTILKADDVWVVGKRSKENDGYDAVILGIGKRRKPGKAELGKYKEISFVPKYTAEFRVKDAGNLKVGSEIDLTSFTIGQKVHVSGITKGKGFQGVVKRWGFKGGQRTHGQSDKQRSPGSIGGGTDPGRVYKGKKMPGRMGGTKRTIQNLEVVKIDPDKRIICIKGAIPGSRNSLIKVQSK